MNVRVRDIYNFLDGIAPFNTAMDFDNCGLLVGNMGEKIDKVLLSLDVTEDVIDEAKRIGVNLIISHHPVIFTPIKRLSFDSITGMLIKNNINTICAHTNLDMASKYGVNACLANAIGLKDTEPLHVEKVKSYKKISVFVPKGGEDKVIDAMCENGAGKLGNYSKCSFITQGEGRFKPEEGANPYIGEIGVCEKVPELKAELICPEDKVSSVIKAMINAHPYSMPAYDIFNEEDSVCEEWFSCGLVGNLENDMTSEEFAMLVKRSLNCTGLRYTKVNRKIKRVAVCSGAGGDYLKFASEKEADAFVTGEIKHHEILNANKLGLLVVDAGHFRTEDIVFTTLKNLLETEFSTIKFYKSKEFTDKIKYL